MRKISKYGGWVEQDIKWITNRLEQIIDRLNSEEDKPDKECEHESRTGTMSGKDGKCVCNDCGEILWSHKPDKLQELEEWVEETRKNIKPGYVGDNVINQLKICDDLLNKIKQLREE